jgi:peptide-methionine (R)-S-oxide reductase
MNRRTFLVSTLIALPGAIAACSVDGEQPASEREQKGQAFEVTKSDGEWRKILTPEQYRVLRQHDTERPSSSALNHEHRPGAYHCAGCDLALFTSDTKFESGTGWPSFTAPIPNAVGTSIDRTLLAERIEVHCRRCGGHLGHVFDDGPAPTGKRYCMNGVSLIFKPKGA